MEEMEMAEMGGHSKLARRVEPSGRISVSMGDDRWALAHALSVSLGYRCVGGPSSTIKR
jgi:hypothetical protein